MSSNPLTPTLPRPVLLPGDAVHVNTHHSWWVTATVVSVAHTTIDVALPGPAGPVLRGVAPWLVHPAQGLRLEAIRDIRGGDRVAAADGTLHTVIAPPFKHTSGWWLLTYDNGQAALPPGTVLRVADPTTNPAQDR